ncbi:hypothetical protein ACS0VU_11040 [Aliiroseovarius sp. KMU-71]|uniref:hypothetical protein n=1 Tax=Aliiroseovarius sp. KMU-71 TaxID=3453123 RepID=UPI003F466F45
MSGDHDLARMRAVFTNASAAHPCCFGWQRRLLLTMPLCTMLLTRWLRHLPMGHGNPEPFD